MSKGAGKTLGQRVRPFLWLTAALGLSGCTSILGDDFVINPGPDGGGGGGSGGTQILDAGRDRSADARLPDGGSGACTPGEKDCLGDQLRTCNGAGVWQVEAMCPYLCTQGACTGICKPGEAKCEGNSAIKCKDNGTWDTATVCTFVCNGGACSGSCAPGTMRCAVDSPRPSERGCRPGRDGSRRTG